MTLKGESWDTNAFWTGSWTFLNPEGNWRFDEKWDAISYLKVQNKNGNLKKKVNWIKLLKVCYLVRLEGAYGMQKLIHLCLLYLMWSL